jgi:lipoprotein-releasing system ATP-binding protein
MLSIENLSKEYPTPRGPLVVLADVTLRLERGESASIMGPSGSGKSTLLYITGALERPTAGRVKLDDTDPFLLSEKELGIFRNLRVGFVFQDHCLLPQLTVLENVLTPTLVAAGRDTSRATHKADAARARELLDAVGLGHRLEHLPAELSGGEKQRVAIARALIRQPAMLLCDEPTGNLDRASAENVISLLLSLHTQQETMLIVVTHNPELATRCARRYVLAERTLKQA